MENEKNNKIETTKEDASKNNDIRGDEKWVLQNNNNEKTELKEEKSSNENVSEEKKEENLKEKSQSNTETIETVDKVEDTDKKNANEKMTDDNCINIANINSVDKQYSPCTTETNNINENENKKRKTKNKNKTKSILTCICVIGIIILFFGMCAIFGNINNDNKTNNTEKELTTYSAESSDKNINSSKNLDVTEVVDKCINSCVGITVYSNSSNEFYFNNYGQSNGVGETASGEGSGVLISEDKDNGKTYVLTCAHVISGGSKFVVTLEDKTEYDATLVGYDSQTDIGVLAIKATGLSLAESADSSNIKVGEECVAIGCPGGLEFMNTVSTGIISNLDIPVQSSIGYDIECIQTTAAINPGNSGGALFNLKGQLIGINSSKIASVEYEGIGFSVPSNTAVKVADELIKNGYVTGRAKIGVSYTPLSNYSNYSSLVSAGIPEGAIVINKVDEDSKLINKDVEEYDIITSVDGNKLTAIDVLTNTLSKHSPGDTIKLGISRVVNNELKAFEINCELVESKTK